MAITNGVFRLFRFGIVGIAASATYALVVLALVDGFSISPGLASIFGYIAGIPVSFFGQKHFTFASDGNAKMEFGRFLLVQALNLAASYGLMHATVNMLGLGHRLGIVVVIVGSALMTYGLLKTLVFLDAPPPR